MQMGNRGIRYQDATFHPDHRKPNQRRDVLIDCAAGNAIFGGSSARPWLPSTESCDGAGERAGAGSHQLSFDGRSGGAPNRAPQAPPIQGKAYGIATLPHAAQPPRGMVVPLNILISELPLLNRMSTQLNISIWGHPPQELHRRMERNARRNSPGGESGQPWINTGPHPKEVSTQ